MDVLWRGVGSFGKSMCDVQTAAVPIGGTSLCRHVVLGSRQSISLMSCVQSGLSGSRLCISMLLYIPLGSYLTHEVHAGRQSMVCLCNTLTQTRATDSRLGSFPLVLILRSYHIFTRSSDTYYS